jgi:hypothetical protein
MDKSRLFAGIADPFAHPVASLALGLAAHNISRRASQKLLFWVRSDGAVALRLTWVKAAPLFSGPDQATDFVPRSDGRDSR